MPPEIRIQPPRVRVRTEILQKALILFQRSATISLDHPAKVADEGPADPNLAIYVSLGSLLREWRP